VQKCLDAVVSWSKSYVICIILDRHAMGNPLIVILRAQSRKNGLHGLQFVSATSEECLD